MGQDEGTDSFPRENSQHGWGQCRGNLKDKTSFPWWQPGVLHPGMLARRKEKVWKIWIGNTGKWMLL